jgi:hypothetical protein
MTALANDQLPEPLQSLEQLATLGCRLGDQERVSVGEHQDVGDQAQSFGDRGAEGEGGERIERIVPSRLRPLFAGSGAVGEPDAGESGRFANRESAAFVRNSGLYGCATNG